MDDLFLEVAKERFLSAFLQSGEGTGAYPFTLRMLVEFEWSGPTVTARIRQMGDGKDKAVLTFQPKDLFVIHPLEASVRRVFTPETYMEVCFEIGEVPTQEGFAEFIKEAWADEVISLDCEVNEL